MSSNQPDSYSGSGPVPTGYRSSCRLMVAVAILGLLALGVRAADKPAAPVPVAPAAPPGPWFDAVQHPLAITDDEAASLCRALFAALRSGTLGADALKAVELNPTPRAVFLSWSDGEGPAGVVFGIGKDLNEAVGEAFRNAQASGRPVGDVRWLKLDLVQYATRIVGFGLRHDPLPQPSLTGVSFPPPITLAFLPEQLLALGAVTPESRLEVHAIDEYFAREKRFQELGRWSGFISLRVPVRACFTQCRSYATDGSEVWPMYRGHCILDTPTAAFLLDAARGLGDRLAGWCNKEGRFRVRLPQWQAGPDGRETLRDHAAALLALLGLQAVAPETRYRETIDRGLKHLLTFLKPIGKERPHTCIAEDYQALLDTNALTVLCLLRAGAGQDKPPYAEEIAQLGPYLLQQVQPDGTFVCERSFPAGNIHGTVSLSASALGVLALVGLYERTLDGVYIAAAGRAMAALQVNYVKGRELDQLPQDEWLVAAIDQYFTFSHDHDLITLTERLALGVSTAINLAPELPDFLGNIGNHPSGTIAASRSRILTTAARLLRDSGSDKAADSLLADAGLVAAFQLQSRIEPGLAMYFLRPTEYVNAFRDHVLAVGLALDCQYTQLFSLLEAYRQAKARPEGALPLSERGRQATAAARQRMVTFPQVLAMPTPVPKQEIAPVPVRAPVPRPAPKGAPADPARRR